MYIQNIDDAAIICKAVQEVKGQEEIRTFRFLCREIDTAQGKQVSSGYNPISKEDLKLLQEKSTTFQYYTNKVKKLILVEDLPASAQTPAERMMGIVEENKKLRDQIAELEKGADGKLKEELDSVKNELAEAKSNVEQLQADLEAVKGELEDANVKIAELETPVEDAEDVEE